MCLGGAHMCKFMCRNVCIPTISPADRIGQGVIILCGNLKTIHRTHWINVFFPCAKVSFHHNVTKNKLYRNKKKSYKTFIVGVINELIAWWLILI